MKKLYALVVLTFIAAPEAATAKARSVSKSMSFEACLAVIRRTASDLRVAPINIVETNSVRMVRFPTVDGSVLVTCSRPDHKMVMTMSTRG